MRKQLWSENQKGKDRSEHLGVYEKIILKWVWTGRIWLRRRAMERSCEYSNKPSGSIKSAEFDYPSDR